MVLLLEMIKSWNQVRKAEGKEDFHQSILYYLKDGGVISVIII